MRDLERRHHGDLYFTLAHYNAGPEALADWMPRLTGRSADQIAEDPNEAEGAFALAAAIALADDDVSDEENAFINQLAEWFGISGERAAEILDQLEEDRDAE